LKKAFTLIEILISVAIIAMIMNVVLEVSSNTKKLYSLNKDYTEFVYISSVAALGDGKNAYEMLKDYNIKNDTIIRYLKKEKLNKKSETVLSQNYVQGNENILLLMKELKIFDETSAVKYYSLEIK